MSSVESDDELKQDQGVRISNAVSLDHMARNREGRPALNGHLRQKGRMWLMRHMWLERVIRGAPHPLLQFYVDNTADL
jgi:hypothetical protein